MSQKRIKPDQAQRAMQPRVGSRLAGLPLAGLNLFTLHHISGLRKPSGMGSFTSRYIAIIPVLGMTLSPFCHL